MTIRRPLRTAVPVPEQENRYPIPPKPHDLTSYRAESWTCANGETTERQPHLFYRAEEVDPLIDEMRRRHSFELRRAAVLEAFLMKELSLGKLASGDGPFAITLSEATPLLLDGHGDG